MAYIDTIKLAMADRDIIFDQEKTRAAGYDIMQIKAGERPLAAMILIYVENQEHKWLSGDGIIFNVKDGKIIRTVGLENDVEYTSPSSITPTNAVHATSTSSSSQIDIVDLGYGIAKTSQWLNEGEHFIEHFGSQVRVIKITETVTFQMESRFIFNDVSWVNEYFIQPDSDLVLASNQQLFPNGDVYEMVFSSRILRLLDEQE